MQQEIKQIREAIEGLQSRIENEYSGGALTFPTIKRRMNRDMAVVKQALQALDRLEELTNKPTIPLDSDIPQVAKSFTYHKCSCGKDIQIELTKGK